MKCVVLKNYQVINTNRKTDTESANWNVYFLNAKLFKHMLSCKL